LYRSVWSLLLDYIESREQKLAAAEELHRFNRDVSENEERITEKMNSLSNDLGRDIKQVHSLWLKHEAFENELTAMEQQLQVKRYHDRLKKMLIIGTFGRERKIKIGLSGRKC
jgi:spectrin beta